MSSKSETKQSRDLDRAVLILCARWDMDYDVAGEALEDVAMDLGVTVAALAPVIVASAS